MPQSGPEAGGSVAGWCRGGCGVAGPSRAPVSFWAGYLPRRTPRGVMLLLLVLLLSAGSVALPSAEVHAHSSSSPVWCLIPFFSVGATKLTAALLCPFLLVPHQQKVLYASPLTVWLHGWPRSLWGHVRGVWRASGCL